MLIKLGKYEIVEELGKGAMGIVYKAFDSLMARYVAIKTMAYSSASDPEFKKRFYKEAQAPGRLHHDNIVIIYELNEDQGIPFIAMEFLEGDDLQHLVRSGFIFTLKKILDIMVQVCEGLNFAHANGIIHRDVKPANIFLLKNGKVKIVDFGIAQISQSSLMTRTGVILGTPSYMSPEQVRSDELSGRSDQFSVGVIMYELLTGRRPFEGDTYTAILYQILHEDPPPLRDFFPTCPPGLEATVLKALSKNPEDRFQDLASLARRLRKLESEMDHDLALENTMEITRAASGGEKSIKVDLIERYMREGKFELAMRVLEKLKQSGESPEILEALQKDLHEKQVLAKIENLLGEGARFFDDEHYDLASECFNEALALEPENPRALEWVRKTHQKEAEKRLRAAIGQYLGKGERELEKKNLPEALKAFGEALKLNPSSREIANRIKQVQQLMEESQLHTECETLCGQAREKLESGHRGEARRLASEALEILPGHPGAKEILETLHQQEIAEIRQATLRDIDALLVKNRLREALALASRAIQETGLDPVLAEKAGHIQKLRRRRQLLTGVPALLVVLAAMAWVLWQYSARSAPPAPGFLSVDIRPAATILAIRNTGSGESLPLESTSPPLRLTVPPGTYEISYQNKAFQAEPASATILVQSGQPARLSLKVPGFKSETAIQEILHEGE